MSFFRLFGSLVMICVCVASRSGAEILDHGDYTLDTSTNLEWLDLTRTANKDRCYEFVASNLSEGGEFEGYRIPRLGEVRTFLSNVRSGLGLGDWAGTKRFIELLGLSLIHI